MKPTILLYERCEDFFMEYRIGSGDLLITSAHTYENYLKNYSNGATVVNLRNYGNGEPNDLMVEAIVQDIKGASYHRVIAVGGGSVLDVAKLFVLKNITPVQELFEKKLDIIRDKELIIIPTTCGTGSEVTNISVIELTRRKTKLALATDELFADYAVLIPELLETLPYSGFAASSLDAFIHAIESYLSPKANAFTEMYSKKAMELILKGYLKIAANGKDIRIPIQKDFLLAAAFAGISFGNAGCGAVHALSYPLGTLFHVAHGEANYVVFHGVFHKYMSICPEGKIKKLNNFLAEILGCESRMVYSKIDALFHMILPEKSLRSYGVTKPLIEEFAESVVKNQGRLLANSYIELKKEDITDIYYSVY
jgi:Alcohol dehydrogenase, class IV